MVITRVISILNVVTLIITLLITDLLSPLGLQVDSPGLNDAFKRTLATPLALRAFAHMSSVRIIAVAVALGGRSKPTPFSLNLKP